MELVDPSRQRLAASRAGYLCRAQEPSRLGVGLVGVAELPYQVGFASLERKLEVVVEPAAEGRRGPRPLWFDVPRGVVLLGVVRCSSRWR